MIRMREQMMMERCDKGRVMMMGMIEGDENGGNNGTFHPDSNL